MMPCGCLFRFRLNKALNVASLTNVTVHALWLNKCHQLQHVMRCCQDEFSRYTKSMQPIMTTIVDVSDEASTVVDTYSQCVFRAASQSTHRLNDLQRHLELMRVLTGNRKIFCCLLKPSDNAKSADTCEGRQA
jgi:hypothetical protein